ncbi:MAG: STAS domain-containing protein [Deltaproteobacteria bacterium]|nr:STAS domain-containing protein [Deltaproteobacteria bacterium]HEN21373.1 anti-sigma factor antagonist [Desulfobacteraceae bacterium]
MEIVYAKEEKASVVSVSGRMDGVSAPDFEQKMVSWINEGESNFVVDFGSLDYISSAGLRSILVTAKKLKAKNGRLLLCSLKDTVKEVFEISGFSSIVPIFDSVKAAVEEI